MRRLILFAILATLTTGCLSRLTGVQGRITFAYPAVADIANFNKPIAPGARIDLKALELGPDGEELQVLEATSLSPDVLKVVGIERNAVVLQGVSVGAARVEVRARGRGSRVFEDVVDMRVEPPDHLAFRHDCTDGEFAAYPANSTIAIPFAMSKSNGQPVIGYGFHPIKITPRAALELVEDSHDQSALHFQSTKARHRVALRSKIDDGILGLALIEPGEVDGLAPAGVGLNPTIVGHEALEFFIPTVAGVPVCQSKLKIVAESRTPDVCHATGQLVDDDESNRESVVRIVGRKYGVCEIAVSYPEANGGAGVTQVFEVPVGKFPGAAGDAMHPVSEEISGEEQVPWWLAGLLGLIAPMLFTPLVLTYRNRSSRR